MTIKVDKKKKSKEENKIRSLDQLNDYQIARWCALYKAVNLIADVAEDKNKSFDDLHIDQIALCKYVDEMSDDIYWQFSNGEEEPTDAFQYSP